MNEVKLNHKSAKAVQYINILTLLFVHYMLNCMNCSPWTGLYAIMVSRRPLIRYNVKNASRLIPNCA